MNGAIEWGGEWNYRVGEGEWSYRVGKGNGAIEWGR